jgi:hypothetical protein
MKREVGRYRHIWEDNIEMDVTEIRCEGVYWIHLANNSHQEQALVNIALCSMELFS